MTEELYKKVVEYIDGDNYVISEQEAMQDAILWFCGALWHDIKEVPKYTEGDGFANQILVFGETSKGEGCSVASMIDEGVVYSPITGHEYDWGMRPFEKWAYVKDLIPNK